MKRIFRAAISRRAEPGMVSVEWALTAPLFIALALLCISVIVYTNSIAVTTDAARAAARAYAIGKGQLAATETAQQVAGAAADVQIKVNGEYVRVTVQKPPVAALRFLGVTVSSQQLALIEPGES